MKKHLFILLALFVLPGVTSAQADSSGIEFFQGNWHSLIKRAARERKLIFVDVYTDWCLPCKRMEKEIFTQKEVAKFYHNSFICYRLDAEQGEGKALSQHYAVKAYPTYLFLDTLGNLVYRSGDYLKAGEFIAAGKKAIDQSKELELAKLEDRFRKGDRDKEFLHRLISKRTQMGLDNAKILNVYVVQLAEKEMVSPVVLHFLSENIGSTASDALAVILKYIDRIPKNDQQKVAQKLYDKLLYYVLARAIKDKKLKDAVGFLADIDTLRPLLLEKQLSSADNLALHYYHAASDTAGLKKVGYRIANKQMSIPVDTIRAKDRIMFAQVMQPFLTGKEDSTKIPDFQQEKKLAATQYSAHVATMLYVVSDFFKQDLDARDKSLNDALKWMQFACYIFSKDAMEQLRSELEVIISARK